MSYYFSYLKVVRIYYQNKKNNEGLKKVNESISKIDDDIKKLIKNNFFIIFNNLNEKIRCCCQCEDLLYGDLQLAGNLKFVEESCEKYGYHRHILLPLQNGNSYGKIYAEIFEKDIERSIINLNEIDKDGKVGMYYNNGFNLEKLEIIEN